jgi:hypothetical protein
VAWGNFTLDANRFREKVPAYRIPYRSLLAAGLENLLVAGRCFSADRLAQSSARIMATGCLTGQAAGVAAALAVKDGIPLRGVAAQQIREHLAASPVHGATLRSKLEPAGVAVR